MPKRKVTYPLEEDLLDALKIRAVREGKPDYKVLDEALRSHLYGAWDDLWSASRPSDSDDDRAMSLALEELDSYRTERNRGGTPPAGS